MSEKSRINSACIVHHAVKHDPEQTKALLKKDISQLETLLHTAEELPGDPEASIAARHFRALIASRCQKLKELEGDGPANYYS